MYVSGPEECLHNWFITELLHNRVPCEHNNKRNAWVADNLAPLGMPFLSMIA